MNIGNTTNRNLNSLIVKTSVYSILLLMTFYSSLEVLIHMLSNEDFTYGYIVPLVVLYLIWENKDKFLRLPSKPSWIGLIPIAIGFLLFWGGELGGEFYSIFLSLWFMIFGLCLLHLGWNKLKTILFPLLFLLTIFPPPQFIYQNASVKLKLISSQLGVSILQLFGMSAYREGNIIDLGFTQLQIVDACNGLRYLIPLIILGILLSYFFKAFWWKKVILVITTIPISIILNSLRIASVALLYPIWGPKVAEGFFHDFSGWLLFMFSLLLLLFEMWMLQKIFPENRTNKNIQSKIINDEDPIQQSINPDEQILSKAYKEKQSGFYKSIQPNQFVVGVLIIMATLIISQNVEFREKIPINRPLHTFPLQIESWTGTMQSMEQKFIGTLDLSDYLIIDYKNIKGENVNFYVAYYESQSKGKSIHSPATCLPGSGWLFKKSGKVHIPVSNGMNKTMPVNSAFMQKTDSKQIVYYWFPQRGRILTNAYQLKLFTFWDALTRQRTDGALVRLMTPVYHSEELKDAEKRLQRFVINVVPILNEFLPE